ncbi:MAG: hypothetical protein A2046_16020 [Bacteroidetes bacterium GWA2_30_7]|nr:MAG: hypothetical protein A2046_16020 [Bacteroidetes bacterium GWA2_30_7]
MLLYSFSCLSQTKNEVMQFSSSEKSHHNHYKIKNNKTPSELSIMVRGLFRLYKFLISSQDSQTCVFEPSCSQYAIESVSEYGIFAGSLNAFDRLTRCNKNTPEKYPRKNKNGKYIDNVL